jgi:hypothetical protein
VRCIAPRTPRWLTSHTVCLATAACVALYHTRHVDQSGGHSISIVSLGEVALDLVCAYDRTVFPAKRQEFLEQWIHLSDSTSNSMRLSNSLVCTSCLTSLGNRNVHQPFQQHHHTASPYSITIQHHHTASPYSITIQHHPTPNCVHCLRTLLKFTHSRVWGFIICDGRHFSPFFLSFSFSLLYLDILTLVSVQFERLTHSF